MMGVPMVWFDQAGAHCTCGWFRPAPSPEARGDQIGLATLELQMAELHTEHCRLHVNDMHRRIDELPDTLGVYVPDEVRTLLHDLIRHDATPPRRTVNRWLADLEPDLDEDDRREA